MADRERKIVILTGPGGEDPELMVPYYWLQAVGKVEVATHNDLEAKTKFGQPIKPTVKVEDLKPEDYDAVVVPGGLEAPDRLRQVKTVTDFVARMFEIGKLVTSTCHGPWVLISAGIMDGKRATGYPGIKDDLVNAGVRYEAAPVVVDGNIITSDHPRDITPWMVETVKWLESH